MAGKSHITPEIHKRIKELKKKDKMKNADIAVTIGNEFGIKAPSLPTISKKLNSTVPRVKKTATVSKGEQLLQEAVQQKAVAPSVAPSSQPVAPSKPKKVQPVHTQADIEEAMNADVDMSKFSTFGSSGVSTLNSALGNLNSLVTEGAESNSINDLLSAVPTSQTEDIYSDDMYTRNDMQHIQDQPQANPYIAPTQSSNYRNDDVTNRNEFNNTGLKTRDELYAEENNSFNNVVIAKIANGAGINLSNDTRVFIERLLSENKAYGCGFVIGGNIYLPSLGFNFLYEIQNGCTGKHDGFVIIHRGNITLVTEQIITDMLEDNVAKGVIGSRKWMTENFNSFDIANKRQLDYNMLIQQIGEDKKSIPYVNMVNSLRQNKELGVIVKIPKLNQNGLFEFNVVVAVTSYGLNVISFVE